MDIANVIVVVLSISWIGATWYFAWRHIGSQKFPVNKVNEYG